MAGVCEPTAKLFEEAGPQSVGEKPRAKLARIYGELEAGPETSGSDAA
jgi:hypothetical protein